MFHFKSQVSLPVTIKRSSLSRIHNTTCRCTCVEREPAESGLLLLGLPLQHGLVQPHSVLVVVISTVQCHAQYFSSAVHRSNPPHRHPCSQTIEVSAGQEVGLQQGVGGGAGGGDVNPPGSAAAALRVVVLPRRPLEEVQHFEDALLAVGLMEEESDGQGRVA